MNECAFRWRSNEKESKKKSKEEKKSTWEMKSKWNSAWTATHCVPPKKKKKKKTSLIECKMLEIYLFCAGFAFPLNVQLFGNGF